VSKPIGRRGGHKTPKNSTSSNRKILIQFGIAIAIVMAYFITIYVLATNFVNDAFIMTDEV